MPLQSACGFILDTTGIVGTTFTVSGLAFQPKAIVFFTNGLDGVPNQLEANSRWSYGIATSTSSRRAYASQSDHGPTTMACDRARANDCAILVLNTSGAIDAKFDINAINSDGFQLITDDAPAGSSPTIFWIAYGGSDISDVAIVDFTEPGATGDQDVTTGFALNTGLDDKAVIFLGGTTAAFGSVESDSTSILGVAAGNSIVNAVLAGVSDDAIGTSATCSYCRSGECIAWPIPDLIDARASVTTWLADGFRLNWAEVNGGTKNFSALVIKGGRWIVGDSTTRTDTTEQDEVVGYDPVSLLIGSHGRAASASDTVDAHDQRIVGLATGAASRYTLAIMDKDAAGSADIGIATSDVAMYISQSQDAIIVQQGAMDLVDMTVTGGGFTYVMDDADPSAAFFWYLAGASAPSTAARKTLLLTGVG